MKLIENDETDISTGNRSSGNDNQIEVNQIVEADGEENISDTLDCNSNHIIDNVPNSCIQITDLAVMYDIRNEITDNEYSQSSLNCLESNGDISYGSAAASRIGAGENSSEDCEIELVNTAEDVRVDEVTATFSPATSEQRKIAPCKRKHDQVGEKSPDEMEPPQKRERKSDVEIFEEFVRSEAGDASGEGNTELLNATEAVSSDEGLECSQNSLDCLESKEDKSRGWVASYIDEEKNVSGDSGIESMNAAREASVDEGLDRSQSSVNDLEPIEDKNYGLVAPGIGGAENLSGDEEVESESATGDICVAEVLERSTITSFEDDLPGDEEIDSESATRERVAEALEHSQGSINLLAPTEDKNHGSVALGIGAAENLSGDEIESESATGNVCVAEVLERSSINDFEPTEDHSRHSTIKNFEDDLSGDEENESERRASEVSVEADLKRSQNSLHYLRSEGDNSCAPAAPSIAYGDGTIESFNVAEEVCVDKCLENLRNSLECSDREAENSSGDSETVNAAREVNDFEQEEVNSSLLVTSDKCEADRLSGDDEIKLVSAAEEVFLDEIIAIATPDTSEQQKIAPGKRKHDQREDSNRQKPNSRDLNQVLEKSSSEMEPPKKRKRKSEVERLREIVHLKEYADVFSLQRSNRRSTSKYKSKVANDTSEPSRRTVVNRNMSATVP